MVTQFALDLFKDPFFIGWDRHFKDLEKLMNTSTNYPPYNLKQVGEDSYVIEIALAGFNREDIVVKQEKNVLTIMGESKSDNAIGYIHKGIGGRNFTRTFSLAEYVEVDNATMLNGLLIVWLTKRVPEEAKPKIFEITDGDKLSEISGLEQDELLEQAEKQGLLKPKKKK
jgi:molecular chaperone IbpA